MDKKSVEDLVHYKSLLTTSWDIYYPRSQEVDDDDTDVIIVSSLDSLKQIKVTRESVMLSQAQKNSLIFEGDYSATFDYLAKEICSRKILDPTKF